MAKQERALRTRHALVAAAAEQFDRDGYEGASLARVSKAADVTMGALTFHFSSKCDLANVVEEQGRQTIESVVATVVQREDSALQRVGELTLELAQLVEKNATVRATVRLSVERGTGCWSGIWLPEVRRLLQEAHRKGELRETTSTDEVADMVGFLLAGVEAHMRAQSQLPQELKPAAHRLEQVWQLVLGGIAAVRAPGGDAHGSGAAGHADPGG